MGGVVKVLKSEIHKYTLAFIDKSKWSAAAAETSKQLAVTSARRSFHSTLCSMWTGKYWDWKGVCQIWMEWGKPTVLKEMQVDSRWALKQQMAESGCENIEWTTGTGSLNGDEVG